MVELAIHSKATQEWQARLHGELICMGDDDYNSARRVWNGMIDKYPALIVRCADVVAVVTAIEFARDHQLLAAVRSGGHSISGGSVCDGGIVIDLSCMKGIWVNPVKKTAWAQAGLTLGEFVQATQAYGLTTTTGTVGSTGLAGLALGGGLGWFMGKYGLTIDNLLSVDLVTADGRMLRASETSHPDLFWGVRGGGGNFGIVTAFKFRTAMWSGRARPGETRSRARCSRVDGYPALRRASRQERISVLRVRQSARGRSGHSSAPGSLKAISRTGTCILPTMLTGLSERCVDLAAVVDQHIPSHAAT